MTVADDKSVIDRATFIKTLLRSFLIQSSWNYNGMQNLGFATMAIPVLRKMDLEKRTEKAGESTIALTDFMNTHPYLASALAGLTFHLKRNATDEKTFRKNFREAKEVFMGPLGAIGDDFFWDSLRPLVGLIGVAFAMIGFPLAGIIAFLLIYNFFHLRARWEGLRHGLGGSEELLTYLKKVDYNGKAVILRKTSFFLLVLLPFLWIAGSANPWNLSPVMAVPGVIIVMALLLFLVNRLGPSKSIMVVFVTALVILSAGKIL